MKRTIAITILALTVLVCLFAGGYLLGFSSALDNLAKRGELSLAQANDRLSAQLEKYQYFPSVITKHPDIVALASNPSPQEADTVNLILQNFALTSGALDIYLMDKSGVTIASSNYDLERSFLGQDFSWRPYFKTAAQGALGRYHAVGSTSLQRGFYFSHPVHDSSGAVSGVIAVKLDLEALESDWRADPNIVFFTDKNSVIFLSNREELLLKLLEPNRFDAEAAKASKQYATQLPTPLGERTQQNFLGHILWNNQSMASGRMMYLSQMDQLIGMRVNLLVPVREAEVQGRLWGVLAASFGGILLLVALIILQRRAALNAAIVREEQTNQLLEAKVEKRTAELSRAIGDLRHEVEERIATEQELRRVQYELIQAGKLSALGELSAGISHELNQPLAAIQTLADNAELLLDMQDSEQVRGNITGISRMADRAGRIIRNLRAFARKENEDIDDINVIEVVDDAISLTKPKLAALDVALDWTSPAEQVLVRGGRVRLQQVLINLISNAADAMAEQDGERRILVAVEQTSDQVLLKVSDTGPGLEQPEHVFEPFYTTKTVGKGLGLGLSISYGIVQSFGGDISGENWPEGGAVFTVRLTPSSHSAKAAE